MSFPERISRLYEVLVTLAQKDLAVKYNNTFLGYIWSVCNPLALAVVFYFAFKFLVKIQVEDYALYLVTGLFVWQWFANSATLSVNIFIIDAQIIKKVNFEKFMLPMSAVLIDMIHLFMAIPVIMVFLYIHDYQVAHIFWVYQIPLLSLVMFLFVYSVSMIFSTVNLFFRDMERLVSIAVMMLFYMTPVLYPIDFVPEEYLSLYLLNPMVSYVELWRGVLLKGSIDWGLFGLSVVYASVSLVVASYIYRKLASRFAEVL